MKIKSIWENINLDIVSSDKKSTDILIIGGGITGITLAYYLKDLNKQVMLIDKGKILNGVTSKTTAKITYLQKNIYQKLKKNAKLYFESQVDAINEIKNIINDNKIECDFKKVDSIIFTNEERNIKKINKERKILNSFNVKTIDIENKNIKSGFKVHDTYQFNPLKYLNKLADIIKSKIQIKENICATNIKKENDEYIISTNKENIKAKIVIIATHYPFFIKPLFLPLKAYVKKEYVNAAKVEKAARSNQIENYTAINIDYKLHSIRYYKDYIIYGSNEHKITNTKDVAKNYYKSIQDFKKYFDLEPEYTWMNQDIVSNDNLPFIGKLDKNLYITTAYNAWGMTNGTIAAKVICDLINNNTSKYQELFNPKRINLKLIIKSIGLIFDYAKVYIVSLFKKNNPAYIKIDGIWYGIYKDKFNKIHSIKLICPHMKCNLVFNKVEKTWDCPCHGSRFDIDGNLIEGPAKDNLKEKEGN